MGYIIGIDASRNRSGGAKVHLIGIIAEGDPATFDIDKVHVWSYKSLLDMLPDKPWLIKHSSGALERNMFFQMFWQRFIFPVCAKQVGCNIVLNTDAGTIARFKPAITMSRDALSYEPGEIKRYGYTVARLRLIILKYIQNRSLKVADGSTFLTNYIADLIQKSTGKLANVKVIPHGVDASFKKITPSHPWPSEIDKPIKLVYVSNIAHYKHQWHVIRAVSFLIKKGYHLELILAGKKDEGKAQKLLDAELMLSDPDSSFVQQLGHISPNKLPVILADSDIFVFASSCETISNTLLEAMAAGLPIACSNRGPMPEVLADGGVYFDPEDANSIAEAIEQVIKDSTLRATVAKRAKKLSDKYSWSRCANETFSFIVESYDNWIKANKVLDSNSSLNK